ncbi:MAG TPA: histidine kinase, partial [Vicinamibacteria bacterium]|nr:histidine kinase [Vicinamibacteria bacterium]
MRFRAPVRCTAIVLLLASSGSVDALGLARWGFAEGRLAPEGRAPSRAPDPLREYGPQVLFAAALLLLIGVIVREHQRLRRAQAALAASYGQLRGLAGRLVTVQEEERRRIARDVHDDIGQRVASLSIALSAAKRKVPASEGSLAEELSALQQQARKIASDLRRLSHELHPAVLDQLGLLEALKVRCAEVQAESGVQIELEAA